MNRWLRRKTKSIQLPDWLGRNLLLFGIFVCFLLGGLFLIGPDLPATGAAGMQIAITVTPPPVRLDTPVTVTPLPAYLTDTSVTDGVIIWGIILVLIVVIGTLGYIRSQTPRPSKPAR